MTVTSLLMVNIVFQKQCISTLNKVINPHYSLTLVIVTIAYHILHNLQR